MSVSGEMHQGADDSKEDVRKNVTSRTTVHELSAAHAPAPEHGSTTTRGPIDGASMLGDRHDTNQPIDLVHDIFSAIPKIQEVASFVEGELRFRFSSFHDNGHAETSIARQSESKERSCAASKDSEEDDSPKRITTEVHLRDGVLKLTALLDTGMDFNMIRQEIVNRNGVAMSPYHGPPVGQLDSKCKFQPIGQVELQVGFPQGGRLRTYYRQFLVAPTEVDLSFDLAIGSRLVADAKILIFNPQGFSGEMNPETLGESCAFRRSAIANDPPRR